MFFGIFKNNRNRQIVEDVLVILLSIFAAIFISKVGLVSDLPAIFGSYGYLGILLAGMGFTSVFTTAPSLTILAAFAKEYDPFVVATLGALGATLGDYVIFKFVRNRIQEDINYLVRITHISKYKAIFKTKLFHFFTPFIGALIISSPFPDEIGLTILGLSRIQTNVFLPLVFVLNGLGIFIITSILNL